MHWKNLIGLNSFKFSIKSFEKTLTFEIKNLKEFIKFQHKNNKIDKL
jgi:hypothetical protein